MDKEEDRAFQRHMLLKVNDETRKTKEKQEKEDLNFGGRRNPDFNIHQITKQKNNYWLNLNKPEEINIRKSIWKK